MLFASSRLHIAYTLWCCLRLKHGENCQVSVGSDARLSIISLIYQAGIGRTHTRRHSHTDSKAGRQAGSPSLSHVWYLNEVSISGFLDFPTCPILDFLLCVCALWHNSCESCKSLITPQRRRIRSFFSMFIDANSLLPIALGSQLNLKLVLSS